MIRKQTKKWTMRDGTKIRICDMTDSHLANTVKMLERIAEYETRNAIMSGYRVLCMVQGEMAELSIENGIRQLEEYGIDPCEISPLYEPMLLDQVRRSDGNI